jgi:GrpB-like predicted nucleotidyltransferase (UPF0157 family)
MRANPESALTYADLKRTLAARHRDDRDAYADGKRAFIEGILESVARDA